MFDQLGLSQKVLDAVKFSGYKAPTLIQKQVIPHIINRRDVLGIAQTGTGKTASFALPMLSLLEQGRARARMPRTLILEPTRELAMQVESNFDHYGKNHKFTIALLIGGTSFEKQSCKLERGADVLIATPGRLFDHINRGKLLMSGIEILVIDEADLMLDMGFIPEIERICKVIPFTRQTLLFSATMPREIKQLTANFLQNPVQVSVTPASTTSNNTVQVAISSPSDINKKHDFLRKLIEEAENLENAIIFCNRKRDVSMLWRFLEHHGYNVGVLHGDMDQNTRTTMLSNFKKCAITILVASDVAARGLDIPGVSHVFNFDVPNHPEEYVHRIGRTGRAGRKGITTMMVTPNDQKNFEIIEKVIGQKIDWHGKPVEWNDYSDCLKNNTKTKICKEKINKISSVKSNSRNRTTTKNQNNQPDKINLITKKTIESSSKAHKDDVFSGQKEKKLLKFCDEKHVPEFLLRSVNT